MFKSAQDIVGCAVGATDGAIGEVEDVYFDDQHWTVRYLVVATREALRHRKILILPGRLGPPDWDRKRLLVSMTVQQAQSAPDIDTNKPVSRQHEWLFLTHYQHPSYWQDVGPPAVSPNPSVPTLDPQFGWSQEHFSQAVAARQQRPPEGAAASEQHLRSSNAVLNYTVRALDGDIGRVTGLLVAEEDWTIRYLVVRSGHWWHGHRVLLAVQWISSLSWLNSRFEVNLSRDAIRSSPPYDPDIPLDRAKEIDLFEHYGRAGYWHPAS